MPISDSFLDDVELDDSFSNDINPPAPNYSVIDDSFLDSVSLPSEKKTPISSEVDDSFLNEVELPISTYNNIDDSFLDNVKLDGYKSGVDYQDTDKNDKAGIGTAFKEKNVGEYVPFISTGVNIAKLTSLINATSRLNENAYESDEDKQADIDAIAKFAEEERQDKERWNNSSIGYKVTKSVLDNVSNVLEFAATGFVGGAASKAGVKGAQTILKKQIKKYVTQAVLLGAARVPQGYLANKVPELDRTYTGVKIGEAESNSKALRDSLLDFGIMYATETAGGELVNKGLSKIIPKKLKASFIAKYFDNQNPGKMGKLLKDASFNGFVGEFAEEEIERAARGIAYKAGFTDNEGFKYKAPSAEELFIEAASIGIMSGGSTFIDYLAKNDFDVEDSGLKDALSKDMSKMDKVADTEKFMSELDKDVNQKIKDDYLKVLAVDKLTAEPMDSSERKVLEDQRAEAINNLEKTVSMIKSNPAHLKGLGISYSYADENNPSSIRYYSHYKDLEDILNEQIFNKRMYTGDMSPIGEYSTDEMWNALNEQMLSEHMDIHDKIDKGEIPPSALEIDDNTDDLIQQFIDNKKYYEYKFDEELKKLNEINQQIENLDNKSDIEQYRENKLRMIQIEDNIRKLDDIIKSASDKLEYKKEVEALKSEISSTQELNDQLISKDESGKIVDLQSKIDVIESSDNIAKVKKDLSKPMIEQGIKEGFVFPEPLLRNLGYTDLEIRDINSVQLLNVYKLFDTKELSEDQKIEIMKQTGSEYWTYLDQEGHGIKAVTAEVYDALVEKYGEVSPGRALASFGTSAKGYSDTVKLVANAIRLQIDSRGSKNWAKSVKTFKNLSEKEASKIEDYQYKLDVIERMDQLTPDEIELANKLVAEQQKISKQLEAKGFIKEAKENYMQRVWDFSKDNKSGNVNDSKMELKRAKARKLDNIVDGWTNGWDLRDNDAINAYKNGNLELINFLAFNNFTTKLSSIKLKPGEWLLDTEKHQGYEEVTNPLLKVWRETSKKVVKPGSNTYEKDGRLYERVSTYAPKKVAKLLNNLNRRSKLYDAYGFTTATQIQAEAKMMSLLMGHFHSFAYIRSNLLPQNLYKLYKEGNLNPLKSYKKGYALLKENGHNVQRLVGAGTTFGLSQDLIQDSKFAESRLYKLLSKNNATKQTTDFLMKLRKDFTDFMFGEFGSGLKVMAALNLQKEMEFKNINENLGHSEKEIDTMVAEIMNNDFGGLHLGRMYRNPETQHALRLTLLAPDWTESNIRSMVKVLNKKFIGKDWRSNSKAEAQMYRKFWTTIIVNATLLTLGVNAINSLIDPTDPDEKDKKQLDNTGLKFLDADVTGLYKALGGKTGRQKGFSIVGHFKDPLKFMMEPSKSFLYKQGFLTQSLFNALKGTDWRGRRFTSLDELLGTDDKGTYKRAVRHDDGSYSYAGDPKGGQKKGKVVDWNFQKTGPIKLDEIQSFAMERALKTMPVQLQNLFGFINGEIDGFDALLSSLGFHVSSTYKAYTEEEEESTRGVRF